MTAASETKIKPESAAVSEEKQAKAVSKLAQCTDVVSYTVDKTDTIVAVSGQWDAFARENGGEKLQASAVIGRKLDQFITGDATRMFVRTMIMSARTLKRPIYRPYRCDSPKLKRFMEMTILPNEDGTVELVHRELHNEPLAQKPLLIVAPKGSISALLKRCSLCNRIETQGIWSEIDEALDANRLEPGTRSLKVVYGVCPDCLTRRGIPL
jgi:hypothetical protein